MYYFVFKEGEDGERDGALQGKSSTKGAKFILIDAAVVWKMYELFSCVQ